jgi:hypothetical protein
MPKIKHKTIHLIIVMTIISAMLPTYLALTKYRHRQKIERLEVVNREVFERMDEFLSYADLPRKRMDSIPLEKLTQQKQQLMLLQQEANELSKGLDAEEAQMIFKRARNESR